MENTSSSPSLSFDVSGLLQKYGVWIAVGAAVLYFVWDFSKPTSGGKKRPVLGE